MSEPVDPTRETASGSIGPESDEAYCPACTRSFSPDHEWCPDDGARLVKLKATKDLLVGRILEGRYQIKSALGEGGMGTVYRGLQLSLDREVAIKVIHAALATDRSIAKRFLREARLSSRLNQPNIINVYEFGQTDDGILYIVMELLEGRTLHDVIASPALDLARTIAIALQLCDALEAAHAQGIIHRDLKPGNIVIVDDPSGRDLVKVLDFGLAKSLLSDASNITNTNAMMGTPLYMAPEQIEGRPSDQRADLYAFGCILYQMLTGRPPFVGDTVNATLSKHLNERPSPLPPHVPRELAALVEALMAKHPEQRIGSAAQARPVLRALATGTALPPPEASIAPVPPRPRRARLVLLGLALAASALAIVVWFARTPTASPASAPRGDAAVTDAAPPDTAPIDASLVDAPPRAAPPLDAPRAGPPPNLRRDAGAVDAHPATPLPPDAGEVVPSHAPAPDAALPPPPPPVDAGMKEPELLHSRARDAGA